MRHDNTRIALGTALCTTMGVIYYYLFDQQKRYAAALKGMDE